MTALLLQDLGLQPAQLRAIRKKAKRSGKTASQYVRSIIERDLQADQSFDQILDPIRKDIRERQISEEHLDAVIGRTRRHSSRKASGARR